MFCVIRIRAIVNRFMQARVDFRYGGDWTALECPLKQPWNYVLKVELHA